RVPPLRFGGSKRMEPDRGHSRQESSHAMEFTPLPGTLMRLCNHETPPHPITPWPVRHSASGFSRLESIPLPPKLYLYGAQVSKFATCAQIGCAGLRRNPSPQASSRLQKSSWLSCKSRRILEGLLISAFNNLINGAESG